MSISGYTDYQRREYCKDIACPIQVLMDRLDPGSDEYQKFRQICKINCIHSTYEFHHWLIEKGYSIVKPEK